MERPERAQRHWLVLVVAPLSMVSVSAQVDAHVPASRLDEFPQTHIARRLAKQDRRRQRRLSCLSQGLMALSVALVQGQAVPVGQFVAFAWPSDASAQLVQASTGVST